MKIELGENTKSAIRDGHGQLLLKQEGKWVFNATVTFPNNHRTVGISTTEEGALENLEDALNSSRRKPNLKLYEISALVAYSSVILAVSEKDALEHVVTWEQAWHENADLIAVSDVEITDVRPLKASDWKDEAHDRTCRAANDHGGENQ